MGHYTVLLCDDQEAIHNSLTPYLKREALNVVSAYDGESALKLLRQTPVDVVVLDVMLPGIDGFDVCREIRKSSDVYIIMLSARGEELDRVVGLELGADDYLSKPFSPREVTVRIKNAIKRIYPRQEAKKLTIAELSVFPESYQVFINDQEISLSSKEVDVLAYMVANAGKALTREHILNAAWSYDYFGYPRVVDSVIKSLRQKLARDDVHFTIRTLYGVGYKIEEKQ